MDSSATDRTPVLAAGVALDWPRFAAHRHPGAGAVASIHDVLGIALSLLRDDGALVAPDTLAMMRTSLTRGVPSLDPYPPERGSTWGFSLNLRSAVPGSISTDGFGHAGWAGTELWIHPEHDVAWALLTNRGAAGALGWDPTDLDNAIVSRG